MKYILKGSKRTLALLLIGMVIISAVIISGTSVQLSAASSTGVGLSAHALKAYNEGWKYVWGGSSAGAVDCSGLIYSYNHVGGTRTNMLGSSSEWGYVSKGIPRIHGLGLHQPGHVGVYIGSGLAIDARDSNSNVVKHKVSSKAWVEWFKVVGVNYPNKGWVKFDGDSFYYENGQYIVSTSRTMDGVTYNFDSSGKSDKHPSENQYSATDYSSSSVSNSDSASKTLQFGSTGEAVNKLQKRLKELGYFNDDTTDYFGSYTKACLIEFQENAGIKADGIATESVLNLIYSSSAPKKTNSSKDKTDKTEETKADEPETSTTKTTEEETKPEVTTEEETKSNIPEGALSIGSTGELVEKLQQRLFDLRYYTADVNGTFGEKTFAAVNDFLVENGYYESEYITSEQLEHLYSSNAVVSPEFSNLQVGYFGDDVMGLQQKLITLDYLEKGLDTGFYGEKTSDAVKLAQSSFSQEVTGIAGNDFVEAVDLEIAKLNTQLNEADSEDIVTVASEITNKALASATPGLSADKNASAKGVAETGTNTTDVVLFLSVAIALVLITFASLIAFFKFRKRAVAKYRY